MDFFSKCGFCEVRENGEQVFDTKTFGRLYLNGVIDRRCCDG